MAGIFGILELGKRTLIAQQFAQNIVGNNISNENTEGYSRQQIQFAQVGSIDTPWGKIGLGTQVRSIQRSRDALVDKIFRQAKGSLSEWSTKSHFLQQVDAIFSEVDNGGIGSKLDAFFNAWHDLANDPESSQPRIALKESGIALTDTFHRVSGKIKEQKENVNSSISELVNNVNDLLKQIANLNAKIPASGSSTGQSNELLDEKDRLLDRLAELVDVNIIDRPDKGTVVYIGSINMVQGGFYQSLKTKTEAQGSLVITKVQAPNGEDLKLTRGKIKALIELRDKTLTSYESSLDTLAKTLVEQINNYHKAGYTLKGETGYNFFDNQFIKAESIKIDDEILNDPQKIIAAAEDAKGDNAQALRIAALKDSPLISSSSIRDYYSSIITQVGIDAQSASDYSKSQEVFANQAALQREEVSGVSLDEEMVDMIKYQQSYLAATRMIKTVDSMIEAIINLK